MSTRDFLVKYTPGGEVDTQHSGFSPEVQKLAATITKQNAKLGKENSGGSPGILSRIFDTISRPLYASANTADYLVQGKNPIEGAWRGLAGQDKTTYDKVLGDMGMEGGFSRSLLGFGADVLLDPTTYLGVGLAKGVTEGTARRVGVDAAANVSKDALSKVASKAVLESAKEALPTTGKLLTKAEKNVVSKLAKQDHLAQVARTAEDTALHEGRGRAFLKFMGKETSVLPKPAGEAIYNVGTKIAETARKSPTLVKVGQAIRPVMNFRHGTNDLLREATGHTLFDGEQYLKQLKTELGHLGSGERSTIFHAIESGENLAKHAVEPKLITLSNGKTKVFKTLEDYKSHVINKLDALHAEEKALGIAGEKTGLVNYVPHIYKTTDKETAAAFKADRIKSQSAFLKSGDKNPLPVVKSAKQAFEKGLKPETDIMQAVGNRAISSFKSQTQARFAHAVENEFGVKLASKVKGNIPKADVSELAKKMGVERSTNRYLSGKDVYFHPDVKKALDTVERVVTDPASGAELGRLFDKVQNAWKLNMTALNPGHHTRNFAGDVFLNFEDGVVNPARYTQSAKVLKNWKTNPEAVLIQVGDRRLNAAQVMDLFSAKGGKSGFFRSEFAASGLKPVEKIREMAEIREDWTRLAHFIDVLKKEGNKVKTLDDLDKVASVAGKRVRKYNIDYGDLTPFERNTMKRVAPFYTWMRKNIPVQLETLALNPGKINAVPKFLNFLNSATGQAGNNPELFGLNLTPLWLRQMASVRVAGEGQGRNGMYWDPAVIPFMDVGQYTEGGPSGILSSLIGASSPFARGPVELATGRSLLTGGPLQDTGMGYAGQNILPPQWLKLAGLTTGNDEIAGIPTGTRGGVSDLAKLLGITLQPVGEAQYKGELRRQQDPLQVQVKNQRQKLIDEYNKSHAGSG